MKKKLLYIGNKLADKGASPTSIDILGPLLEQEGYTVYYASSYKSKTLRMFHMIVQVLRLHKKTDYVLIDTYSTANFWYAVVAGRLCKVLHLKYLPILRGGKLPYRLKKSPQNCKNLFENAYLNIAPSRYLLQCFEAHGFHKIKLVPNSIPIARYTFKMRSSLRPRLLWVRAFAKIYNPLLALKILKELAKTYPEATLCMVGADKDGSMEDCKKYAEKHQISVDFTGKLGKNEWLKMSEDFDIFINTTHYDNSPVSVMEAMALGLPVITTNVGGIPYLLQDGEDALLVGDNDCQGFCEAINTLINHPEKAQALAEKAREKSEKYDWHTIKSLWKNILL